MTDDLVHGRLVALTRITFGGELVADAAVGDTVLYVDDVADYDELGGMVLFGGDVYEYDEVDDDASTITLTTTVSVAGVVGDPVDRWDPDGGGDGTGALDVDYEADVVIDGQSTGSLQVGIDHALIGYLEESIRSGAQESVSMAAEGDDLIIVRVHGKEAVVLMADAAITAASDAFDKAEAGLTATQYAIAISDGRIDTYYQPAPPWPNGSTAHDDDLGDLWYDTDAVPQQAYRWLGASNRNWVLISDQSIVQALANAQSAQTTADGKITHFVQATPPVAEGYGDIWTDTAHDNLKKFWDGDSWEPLVVGSQAFADEFIGKIFTATSGGQFRTSTGPTTGMKIDSAGLRTYDGLGNLALQITTTGVLSTYGTIFGLGSAGASFNGPISSGGQLSGASLSITGSAVFSSGIEVDAGLTVFGTAQLMGNVAGFHAVGDILCDTQVKGAKLFATAADTTGSTGGDDVRIGTEGQIKRVTSAEKYKKFIRPAEIDPRAVLDLEPVSYEYRATCRPEEYVAGQRDFGFIADWADALGLTPWVGRGEDGQIETFRYGSFIVAEHVALRFVDNRVTTIEDVTVPAILARLDALEAV